MSTPMRLFRGCVVAKVALVFVGFMYLSTGLNLFLLLVQNFSHEVNKWGLKIEDLFPSPNGDNGQKHYGIPSHTLCTSFFDHDGSYLCDSLEVSIQ